MSTAAVGLQAGRWLCPRGFAAVVRLTARWVRQSWFAGLCCRRCGCCTSQLGGASTCVCCVGPSSAGWCHVVVWVHGLASGCGCCWGGAPVLVAACGGSCELNSGCMPLPAVGCRPPEKDESSHPIGLSVRVMWHAVSCHGLPEHVLRYWHF